MVAKMAALAEQQTIEEQDAEQPNPSPNGKKPFRDPSRNGRRNGGIQARDLRALTYAMAIKLADGTANEHEIAIARDLTGLVRAWADVDDRVRIHRGKPLPGTLRPSNTKPRKRGPAGATPLQVVVEATPKLSSIVSG